MCPYCFPVNFDIEVIKPGCGGVPTFNYARKLQFTLLLMTLTALLFALACMLRMCLRARAVTCSSAPGMEEEMDHELDELANHHRLATDTIANPAARQVRNQPVSSERILPSPTYCAANQRKGLTPSQQRVMERSAHLSMVYLDFKSRLCHALLILMSIFYLRLTTLLFEGLLCDRMPNPTAPTDSEAIITNSLYLREDGQTACWMGSHNLIAAGAIILLLVYSAGYPLFCFVLLTRAFTDESSTGALGWLRLRFLCLRGNHRGRIFSVARTAVEPVATAAQDIAPAEWPSSPSRGGWMQQPNDVKYEPTPACAQPLSSPSASIDELQRAVKMQRHRESVLHSDPRT